jgi:YgiT-type zinc finger domain-containing protein
MFSQCLLCGGNLTGVRENITEKVLGYVFEFKNVPVLKCAECGEIHFSADVNKFIEEYISNKVKQAETTTFDFRDLENRNHEAVAVEC